MKTFLRISFVLLFFNIIGFSSFAQCTPGDATTCPDPENNGEVCPAVLPTIYVGAEYSQQFTVLAPPKLDTNGLVINLHHITLINVENLPQGIGWQSNAVNNEFFVGTYYCVLLSGTTQSAPGIYPIKIVVDIYTSISGVPVLLGRTTDSTSLSVEVGWNPNGISDNSLNNKVIQAWPNPFGETLNVKINQQQNESVEIEMYDLLGKLAYQGAFQPGMDGLISLQTSSLTGETYLLSVLLNGERYSQLISRIK